jgi:hypothetical protein
VDTRVLSLSPKPRCKVPGADYAQSVTDLGWLQIRSYPKLLYILAPNRDTYALLRVVSRGYTRSTLVDWGDVICVLGVICTHLILL